MIAVALKSMGRRRYWIGAALFISEFWPRLVDLDDLPPDAPDGYREEAISTFWLAHDNPVGQNALRLLGQRIAVRDWRVDPGSCDGGSTTWPALRDVRTTVTMLGPWGLPLARDAVTCGGAGWHDDADFVAAVPRLPVTSPDGGAPVPPPPPPPHPPAP